jgi:hypothetical protein
MMTPKKGLSVLYGQSWPNGDTEHAAIVTKVHGEAIAVNGEQAVIVSLTVFPAMMTPQLQDSIHLFRTKAEAERSSLVPCAYWPE